MTIDAYLAELRRRLRHRPFACSAARSLPSGLVVAFGAAENVLPPYDALGVSGLAWWDVAAEAALLGAVVAVALVAAVAERASIS